MVVWAGLALALVAIRVEAQSEQDRQAAARAFEEGQRAQLAGNHARAAELFELAHRAAPAAAAIRSAIRNHREAGNEARAATLALQALSEFASDPATATLASETLQAAEATLARATIRCDAPCGLSLDGSVATLEEVRRFDAFVTPGSHEVLARFETGEARASFEAEAGARLEVPLAAPPAPVVETETETEVEGETETETERRSGDYRRDPVQLERESRVGLSPVVTWIGLGVTVVLGAVTFWSFADTYDASDRYEENPTEDSYDEGVAKWRRSWALGGVTAGLAVSTILVALLGTDWEGEPDEEGARLVPLLSPEGGGLQLGGRF